MKLRKRWTLIALAIFASWLLDRAGWIEPLLWAGLALLVLTVCAILLDGVVHRLRPVNGPRRPGVFGIVRDIFREVRAERALEKWRAVQTSALADARQAAQSGSLAPLESLAAQGLGDAWLMLAEYFLDPASAGHDEMAATAAYEQATRCTGWVNRQVDHALTVWEDRVFLGLGVTTDYAELIRRWEAGYIPGDRREQELAWLYAFGHGVAADAERAWYWLALSQARWSTRDPARLPDGDIASLRTMLEIRLSRRQREKLEKQAADLAYAEFVASR